MGVDNFKLLKELNFTMGEGHLPVISGFNDQPAKMVNIPDYTGK